MKHIGNEIDKIIKKKGLKTKDIAEALGIWLSFFIHIGSHFMPA